MILRQQENVFLTGTCKRIVREFLIPIVSLKHRDAFASLVAGLKGLRREYKIYLVDFKIKTIKEPKSSRYLVSRRMCFFAKANHIPFLQELMLSNPGLKTGVRMTKQ